MIGHTDRTTDGRMDKVIPISPPPIYMRGEGGIKSINSSMSVVLTNSVAYYSMMPGNDVIANKVHFAATKQIMNQICQVWKP